MALLILMSLSVLFSTVHSQGEGSIRLNGVNRTRTQGRVEIFTNGEWGTVCSRYFSRSEAKVVCRQIGGIPAEYLEYSVPVTDLRFGPGTGLMLIEDIRCHGYETSILNCMLQICTNLTCDHNTDVGVICIEPHQSTQSTLPWFPPPVITTPIYQTTPPWFDHSYYNYGKCVNSQNSIVRIYRPFNDVCLDSGVVQVFINGQWIGVCDDFWQRVDAQVICRMLCYEPGQSLSGSEDFDTSSIPETIMMTNVSCFGYEHDIRNCHYSLQYNSCGRDELAKVTCGELTVTPTIQPPDLNCENSMITANFSAAWEGFVPHSQLTVVWHQTGLCNAQRNDYGTYFTFSIPFDQCGTIRTWNSTHIIYKNALLYVPAPTGIITRVKTYMIYVQCEIDRLYYVEKPILPATVSAIASAQGNYTVLMHFYTDNFQTIVTQYPVRIPVGNWLNVGIELITTEQNLILIVTQCFATPSSDRNHPTRYSLISDKCKDDITVCLYYLEDTLIGVRYQTFKFVQYNEVHLHCDAYICPGEDRSQDCDHSCFRNAHGQVGKRKKRAAERKIIHIKSDVILMYDPADEQGGLTYFGPTRPSYPDKFTTPAFNIPPFTTPSQISDNILIASNEVKKVGNKETEKQKQVKEPEPEQPTPTKSSVNTQIVFTTQNDVQVEVETEEVEKETVEGGKETVEGGKETDTHGPGQPVATSSSINTQIVFTTRKDVEVEKENVEGEKETVEVEKETEGERVQKNDSHVVDNKESIQPINTSPDNTDENNQVTSTELEKEMELKPKTTGTTSGISETGHPVDTEEKPDVSSLKPTDVLVVTKTSVRPMLASTKHYEKKELEEVSEEVHESNATFERLVFVGSSATGIQIQGFSYFLALILSSAVLFLF